VKHIQINPYQGATQTYNYYPFPWVGVLICSAGFGALLSIFAIFVGLGPLFGASVFSLYLDVIVFSPLFVLFQLYVLDKMNATPYQSVFIAVVSPLLPLALLMSPLAAFNEINRIIQEQIGVIAVQPGNLSNFGSLSPFVSLFPSSMPDALFIGLLFYIFLNLGNIYIILKYRTYNALLLLLLMPVVFSIAYLGVIALTFVTKHILPVLR